MKKHLLYLACIFFITAIVIGISGCDSIIGPTESKVPLGSQQTGIWVTGEGEIIVVPDMAILTLGVEAQADTVAQAQSEATAAMNDILAALRDGGIEENDIQTQYYSIYPTSRWDQNTGEQELTGYQVTNMVTVKVREVENTGTIIDAVAAAGGNYIIINNIEFTVDDPAPYQEQAREKALADAEKKARQIADIADIKLGTPTYVNESISYNTYKMDLASGMGIAVPAPEISSSISPGETTITVIMQVAYSID
jgi:uncharacterized protein YggE